MNRMSTREIAALFGVPVSVDTEVDCVCIDTRKITKGCLFICIKGENFDGNDFAEKALEQGAAAVICNSYAVCGEPAIRVEDTRKALLALASYYRSKFDIPVVALTGSVGKTTTKEMTALVLSGKYKTLKTHGNFNNEIGLPQVLFKLDGDTQAAVIEMGMNHFGEISALSKAAKPTVGLITNIGVSHIENLGSREGIFKAKMEILDGLAPNAPLVVNGDDDFLEKIDDIQGHRVWKFGIHNGDFRAENIRQDEENTSFDIVFSGGRESVLLPTVGIHNVYDALAAFAVGCLLEVDSASAALMLSRYVPEGMRQKLVKTGGVTFVEDCYNASPDSMRAAVDTLLSLEGTRKIAVLADMLELGGISEQAHRDIGCAVGEAGVDYLLAYGNHSRWMVQGALGKGIRHADFFETKEAVADALAELIEQGDVVLFKASRSMKMEEVIHSVYDRWEKK